MHKHALIKKRMLMTTGVVIVLVVIAITSLNNVPKQDQAASVGAIDNEAATPTDQVPYDDTVEGGTVNDGTYCFGRTQEATVDEPYAVEEHIKLTVIGGESVSGTKYGTQSGPDLTDGYEGELSGTIKGKAMDLLYSYNVDGSDGREIDPFEFRDGGLIMKRWALKDDEGVLIPDRVGAPKIITYTKEACAK